MTIPYVILAPLIALAQVPDADPDPELETLMEGAAGSLAEFGYEFDLSKVSAVEVPRSEAGEYLYRQTAWGLGSGYLGLLPVMGERFRLGFDSEEGLREAILGSATAQFLAFYDPQPNRMVFLEGNVDDGDEAYESILRNPFGLPDDDALRLVVTHELVHAYRDQQIDLFAWLSGEGRTREEGIVHSCLSEGEAQLAATAVQLRQADSDLSQVPVERPLPMTVGNLAMLLPYHFGELYQLRRWKEGGFDAVRASFENPPASTEQILHPEKLGSDAPREVPPPTWPENLGEAELVHEDTLGELLTLGFLLDARVPALDAQLGACGWDGDRIVLYRTERENVLMWRSVWDRPEDATEFARLLDQRTRQSTARVRGRIVEWVSAKRSTRRRDLLDHLEQLEFEVETDAGDVATTLAAENELDADRPRLADGRWIVPAANLSLPAPEGWTLSDQNGVPMLHDGAGLDFADNFSVLIVPLGGEITLDQVETATRDQVEQLGFELVSDGMREVGNHQVYESEYTGSFGGPRFHWLAIAFLREEQQVVVTATVEAERWEERESIVREVLAGMRDLDAPPAEDGE